VIVFLTRHAHSAPEQPGFPDVARHLTGEGRRAARTLGDKLKWYDVSPSIVWTSPAVRAVQTAELVIAGLGWDGPLECHPALAPGADVRTLAAELRGVAPDAHVLVIGHEPGISGLGALLSAKTDFPVLKKAQIARLDSHEGDAAMHLRWLFSHSDEAPIPLVG
jgi:phosphohistidine phosphatase